MFIARRIAVGILSFLTIAGFFSVSVAQVIPVPNGDFTDPGNVGSIGGSLLGGDGGPTPIGSNPGPWEGAWTAALGVLAQPTLTIRTHGGFMGGGSATISGILGVSVFGGVVNNGGNFSDFTTTTFTAGDTYQLTADVNVGSVLTVGLLSTNGVGIGLTNGSGTVLSATTTASPSLVSLTLLSGTTYALTLDYTAPSPVPSGDIGITLFDKPSGLLTANLFGHATFSHVDLATVPEPAPIVLVCVGLLGLVGFRFLQNRHRLSSLAC